MHLHHGVGEDSRESLEHQGDQISHLEGSQPWIFIGRTDEAEALILWLSNVMSRLIEKDPVAGKDWSQEEKGMTEDEMVAWHHWLNGHELDQTLGKGEGQANLASCSPWSCK